MRGGGRFLVGLVVVLAIIWLGFWWYAEGRMEQGFAAWSGRLTQQGWKVSYDADKRGVSPLAAKITLVNLVMSPPANATGRPVTIRLPSLALRIEALQPLVLHTDFPNKAYINVGSQIDVALAFGSIAQTAVLDLHRVFAHQPYPFRSYAGLASNVDVLASQGSLLVLHIDSISSHGKLDRDPANNGTMDLRGAETFDGIVLSPLMTKVLNIPFGGKIGHFEVGVGLSGVDPAKLQNLTLQMQGLQNNLPAQRQLAVSDLHDWAKAGGGGNIAIDLVLGPTTLKAGGTLKFDAAAQPAGSADVTADHLDELTAAITNAYPQVQDQITQTEARASPYLTTSSDGGQTLALHVIYGDGAVTVNGQKSAMPPVNWNALLNPQPAN